MKKNIDYIYEYSDLNTFQTRVKILQGKYKDVILEFGTSGLAQWTDSTNNSQNLFNFDYTIYEKPDNLQNVMLLNNKDFELYLKDLLINIINDRREDGTEIYKLREASSVFGMRYPTIPIDKKWYKK